MFHVKHLLLFLLLPLIGLAQASFTLEDKAFTLPVWNNPKVKEQVIRQVDGKKLNAQEISFYYWCNMMRMDPPAFYQQVMTSFLEQFPEANGKEAKSLAADMQAIEHLPLFEYSTLARDAALEHAVDLMSMNGLSHVSSDGRSFSQRVRINGINRCAGENIYTGKPDGLLALIMLLLDIGLETAGHRKALLSPFYVYMAPAMRRHKTENRHILVQVFTCK